VGKHEFNETSSSGQIPRERRVAAGPSTPLRFAQDDNLLMKAQMALENLSKGAFAKSHSGY
jgi:hypothetical protein